MSFYIQHIALPQFLYKYFVLVMDERYFSDSWLTNLGEWTGKPIIVVLEKSLIANNLGEPFS